MTRRVLDASNTKPRYERVEVDRGVGWQLVAWISEEGHMKPGVTKRRRVCVIAGCGRPVPRRSGTLLCATHQHQQTGDQPDDAA